MFDQVMTDFVCGLELRVNDHFYGHNLTFYEFFNFTLITQLEVKQVSKIKDLQSGEQILT